MILLIIGGALFVVGMLLLLAADNRVEAAASTLRAADRKLWLAREVAIAAGIDPYTIGLPAEDVDDAQDVDEPDASPVVEETPGRHRDARHLAWLRDRTAAIAGPALAAIRGSLDRVRPGRDDAEHIAWADGLFDVPECDEAEPTLPVPVSPAVAGALIAEGLGVDIDAELAELMDRIEPEYAR